MSEQLQIGDRVTCVGLTLYKPADEAAAHVLSGQAEGIIIDKGREWSIVKFGEKQYHVPTKNLHKVRKRRTFEEIIDELGVKLGWKVEISPIGAAHIVHEHIVHCIIGFRGGDLEIIPCSDSVFLKPEELAVISAACSEIAANCQAKHGKEDEQ